MLLYYDLRLNLLVERPGLEQPLAAILLKRGGREPLQVQFGRSPSTSTGQSVQSEPTWTAEQLSGTPEVWAGIKANGDFEGAPLALTKSFTWDATDELYDANSGGIDLNTTALNAALQHDSTTGNDIAQLPTAMFEVKWRDTAGDNVWRAARNQVVAAINHNVLDGSEGTPSNADAATGGLTWEFSTTTTDADPGANTFRYNNATPASVTFVYLDDTSTSGVDVGAFVDDLASGDYIYIEDSTAAGQHQLLKLSGAATDGTGYWKIPVTHQDGATLPTDGAACYFGFILASGGGAGGAFSDSADPVVLNTTTKDVAIGAAQINAAKLSVDGDADQVQLAVQGHSTQTASLVELENSAGTIVYSIDVSGNVTVSGTVDGRDVAADGTKLDGVEASADVTDATNVAAAGAVMTDASADADGVQFLERADHPNAPAATKGQVWLKNSTPATLYFTDDAGTDFQLGTGGSGISNVVEDVTPQLGGTLDANSFSINFDALTGLNDVNGDAALVIDDPGGAAVNYFRIFGGDAGGGATLYADGSDANIDFVIAPKGTGNVNINGRGLILGAATNPTPTTEGEMWWDSDDDALKIGDGTGTVTIGAGGGGDVSDGDTLSTGLTFPNAGLHILDTNGSHDLIVAPGSDLTADRTFTITTGDADRTLTLTGDGTIAGGTHSGTNTGDQTITLTGDVTGSGTGSFAATIASDAVTYDKMQDTTGTDVLLGRSTAGAGTVEEVTCTEAGRALLDDASASAQRDTLEIADDQLSWGVDNAGTALTTGLQTAYIRVPFDCTINAATLYADQSGSIVLDLWKDTHANFPPTIADTITAAAKPTLSTARSSRDATLTGWTTSCTKGDLIFVSVDSVTTVTAVNLFLEVTRG